MRRARFTYIGAFHHLMNRGINGEPIFGEAADKECFTDLLEKFSKLLKIRILAYCLLDNHYHLVLENTSGEMSEFAKRLNGNYGNYYRKMYGGKGYVFQSRYNSTIVQEDSYLIMSLLYLYLNPVRAGITTSPFTYHWSSIHELFNESITGKTCDTDFVESLFGDRETLVSNLTTWKNKEIPVDVNRHGEFLGDHMFPGKCQQRFSRRKEKQPDKKKESKRIFDQYFRSPEDVIREFEEEKEFRFGRLSRESLEFGTKGTVLDSVTVRWYYWAMRRARFTYIGAFHHLMNRGINGEPIFGEAADKEYFTDLLEKFSKLLKIRILAYCLLDNHYHLVLENTSGEMSDFAKRQHGN